MLWSFADRSHMQTKNILPIKSFLSLFSGAFLTVALSSVAQAQSDFDMDLTSEDAIQAESLVSLKEVAIAGDSWGFLTCAFHSVDRALMKEKNVWGNDKFGLSNDDKNGDAC
jgi:hypothetical protein